MSRIGEVYLFGKVVGEVRELIDGSYQFAYQDKFLNSAPNLGVSLTLPPRKEIYTSDQLFAFFDGLIPEGWLLDHTVKNWKVRPGDRMGLLLSVCQDTIGATHIVEKGKTPFSRELVGEEWKEHHQAVNFQTKRCLITYQELSEGFYQKSAAKRMFGSGEFEPVLEIGLDDLENLAREQVNTRLAVTGVQKKISMHLQEHEQSKRLTIVNFDGQFILKPPSPQYPQMPEMEHLCMKLAEMAGFKVAESALIPLRTGELAFITKRFDRQRGKKFYQEDFCQLMEKPTADKYKSSLEKAAKVIQNFCQRPQPELALFFDLNLFSFFIGNADMHLKNFSLIQNVKSGLFQLSPCYDLLCTKLLIPEDEEECALALHGKRAKLKYQDWINFGLKIGLKERQLIALFQKYKKLMPKMEKLIQASFLSNENKQALVELMKSRILRLNE